MDPKDYKPTHYYTVAWKQAATNKKSFGTDPSLDEELTELILEYSEMSEANIVIDYIRKL